MEGVARKPLAVMTNLEFFEAYCTWDSADMRIIQRMVNAMLDKKGVRNKPLWFREDALTKWLREPFDEEAWYRAKLSNSHYAMAM